MQALADKFVLAIAIAGLSLAVTTVRPVQAATISYNFELNTTNGLLAGEKGQGSFSYDDSTLTGKGLESLGKKQGLSVQLNFLGTNYTEADDVNNNDDPTDIEPLVDFANGNLSGLNLSLLKSGQGPLILIRDRSFNIPNFGSRQTIGFGSVTYSKAAPEPGNFLGVSALGIIWLLSRQKKLFQPKSEASNIS